MRESDRDIEREREREGIEEVVNMSDGKSPLLGEIRATWGLALYIAPVLSPFNSYLLVLLNCQQFPAFVAFTCKMPWKC